MHDSVQQKNGQPDIMRAVLMSKKAKFALENGNGFNVLQWAAVRNNIE